MDDIKEPLMEMIVPFPYWSSTNKKTNKNTKQIVSLNNMSRWYRYGITRIKNDYKAILKDFFIPDPQTEFISLRIEYEVQRHNKRRVDSMNIIAFADKWILDSFVETGWLKDDDKCYHVINPAQYVEGIVETQLKMKVFQVQ